MLFEMTGDNISDECIVALEFVILNVQESDGNKITKDNRYRSPC